MVAVVGALIMGFVVIGAAIADMLFTQHKMQLAADAAAISAATAKQINEQPQQRRSPR
jgi:uncharacterized membrane protein